MLDPARWRGSLRGMEKGFIRAAMAAIALASLAAWPAYAERVELEPASPWNVNYAENSCELRRVYEHDGKQAFLYLRQYAPGVRFELIAGSSDFGFLHTPSRMSRRNSGSKQPEVRTMWVPDSEATEIKSPLFLELGDGGRALATFGSLRADKSEEEPANSSDEEIREWVGESRNAREKAITGFQLDGVFDKDLHFKTGSLHGAMEAMRACTDELVGHWGLDAEVQRNLSRHARPVEMKEWAREIQLRYPVNMVRNRRQAALWTFLSISAEGRVTNCRILNEYNDPAFEEATCKGLEENGSFEPALDENGNPVESFYIMTVVYRIG